MEMALDQAYERDAARQLRRDRVERLDPRRPRRGLSGSRGAGETSSARDGAAPMIEHQLDIPTADGAMNSFVVHPEEGGPFPVVLFYMDAPGKREELHDMARRIAAVGYFVVLPNLYYRRSRDYCLKERTEPEMAEMFAQMATLDRRTTECDTRRCCASSMPQPQADGRRIGAVGYCMSGPFVMWAAAAIPERSAASPRSTVPTWSTDKPDSPHRMAPDPLRELLRLRRDRQVGAPGRHRGARGGAAGCRHAVPGRVVPGRRARLRVPAARHRLRQGLGRAALGAAVRPVRAHAPGRSAALGAERVRRRSDR